MPTFLLMIVNYALLSIAIIGINSKTEQTKRVAILSGLVVTVALIWSPEKPPNTPWLIYALTYVVVPIGVTSILKLWGADVYSNIQKTPSSKASSKPKPVATPVPKKTKVVSKPKVFQQATLPKQKNLAKSSKSNAMLLNHSQIKRVDKKLEKFAKILEDLQQQSKKPQLSKKSVRYIQQGMQNTPVKINMLYEYIYQAMLNAQGSKLLPRQQKGTYIDELIMCLYKVQELRQGFETLAKHLLTSNQDILSQEDMGIFTKLKVEPDFLVNSSPNLSQNHPLPNIKINQQAAKLWESYDPADQEDFWEAYNRLLATVQHPLV